MTKPHQLTTHLWSIMLTLSLGDYMSNLSLVGPLNSFWHPKQLPVGMAMTKPQPLPHPHMFNNSHSSLETTYLIQYSWSFD